MKFKKMLLFVLTLLSLLASYKIISAQDARFECGGRVETEVWELWDANVRDFLNRQQLHEGLIKQGDVYALYDIQTYTHNAVSMARRCNRTNRLLEVSRLVRTAYGTLEPGTSSSPGRRWVCRGGVICNDKNRLLDQEVMLDSIQFLALACSLANALMSSDGPLGDEEKAFVGDTVQIVTEHLIRWGDKATVATLRKTAAATPQDVKDGCSSPFFHGWQAALDYHDLCRVGRHNIGGGAP